MASDSYYVFCQFPDTFNFDGCCVFILPNKLLQTLFDCFFLGISYFLLSVILGVTGCKDYILLRLFASGFVLLFLAGLAFLLGSCLRVVGFTFVSSRAIIVSF